MNNKQRLAMGLFFLLGISNLIFGSFIMYEVYDKDHLEGRTTIMGYVLDTNENPIAGVKVNSSDRETFSDHNGYWELNGVKQGYITLSFYKPGYVLYSLRWLAYPENEFTDIEKSPNNISYSFTNSGSDDLYLQRELVENIHHPYTNGSISLKISGQSIDDLNLTHLYISNSSGPMVRVDIDDIPRTMDVKGDGSFIIGLTENGPFMTGFHPVGEILDISHTFILFYHSNSNSTLDLPDGNIRLVIDEDQMKSDREYLIRNNITGEVVEYLTEQTGDDVMFQVDPGVYDVEITGEAIRDQAFRGVVVNSSEVAVVSTTLVEGDINKDLDLSLTGNYFIAVAYIGIALVLFYAAIYMKKGGSWAVLVILAFVGIISQGFRILDFNINTLIAIVLVVVLISIRAEYNRKRERLIKARGQRRI